MKQCFKEKLWTVYVKLCAANQLITLISNDWFKNSAKLTNKRKNEKITIKGVEIFEKKKKKWINLIDNISIKLH